MKPFVCAQDEEGQNLKISVIREIRGFKVIIVPAYAGMTILFL